MIAIQDQQQARWGQIAVAGLAQNIATGLCFGSFGSMVLAIEHDYASSRRQSSLALSLAIVSLSLTAMLIGRIIDRLSLRALIMAGTILCAAGFAAAATVHTALQLQVVYTLMIGPGTAAQGVLPAMTLATRWVPPDLRGRALGFVNMPVMVMIVPLAIGVSLAHNGPRTIYSEMAFVDIAILPLLLLIREGAAPQLPALSGSPVALSHARHILGQPIFWVLALTVGLITGAGTLKLAHFIPMLVGQGRSFAQANTLLALSAGSGLGGSVLFGFFADRMGGLRALALNAAIQAVVWPVLLLPVSTPALTVDAIVVGACGGGVQAAFGVAVVTVFGASAFGRAFSLFQIATLPFLFGMTPLAGLLFEATGSYHLPMALTVASLAGAAVLLFFLPRGASLPDCGD